MRPIFIAGNWKMNPSTGVEAESLARAVKEGLGLSSDVHVALCTPTVFLDRIDSVLDSSPIGLGAQNMHWESQGAYTGEHSAGMLLDAGCTHVILGHSERRHGMGETDAQVNKKLKNALTHGLIPIVCIGETQEERHAGRTEDVLRVQLEGSLAGLEPDEAGKLVLAYEPVWAIGTGVTATLEQAQQAHAFVRDWLTKKFGEATARRLTIQYGGSVKASNALELLGCPDIDGALVGGASLNATEFLAIIEAGSKAWSAKRSEPKP